MAIWSAQTHKIDANHGENGQLSLVERAGEESECSERREEDDEQRERGKERCAHDRCGEGEKEGDRDHDEAEVAEHLQVELAPEDP